MKKIRLKIREKQPKLNDSDLPYRMYLQHLEEVKELSPLEIVSL